MSTVSHNIWRLIRESFWAACLPSGRLPYGNDHNEQVNYFVSSPSNVRTPLYSVQTLMYTATPVAILAKHNVFTISNTESLTIWKPSRGKKLGPKILTPIDIRMTSLTANHAIFSLLGIDYPKTVAPYLSSDDHWYNRSRTCKR